MLEYLYKFFLVPGVFTADLITATSYVIISLFLMRLAWHRDDIKKSKLFWFFTLALMSRAFIHCFMAFNTVRNRFDILIPTKIVYAVSSIGLIYLLWKVFPQLIKLPTFDHLATVNAHLEQTIAELTDEKEQHLKVQEKLIQSQKMEAVGQLTGGIAHDFNNLLQAIGGNLELIRRNPLSSKIDRWLGNSIESVARAAHLTGQLLTFSRDQKLDLKEISLLTCMTNLKNMVNRVMGIAITIVMEDIDDVIIFVDPIQLELALLNLSLNARDAIVDKGTITFSTQCDDHHVEINVTDTGHGIPEPIASKIFDPFFTTKDIGKGTGLGLSMVHSVMLQFEGDVYIKQTSPKGTTFTLSLPLVANRPVPAKHDVVVVSDQKHVLVIDDERVVREILEDFVQEAGYRVDTCEDGAEALVFLKTTKPDLVLCDFAMPMMTGDEVSRAIKMIYPDLPLVFVTGYAKSDTMGDHLVLKKPFGADKIKAIIEKALQQ
jgi:signal transduction histidine kinase